MKESEGSGEGLDAAMMDGLENQLALTDGNLLFLPSGKDVDIKWMLYTVSVYTRSRKTWIQTLSVMLWVEGSWCDLRVSRGKILTKPSARPIGLGKTWTFVRARKAKKFHQPFEVATTS